MCGVCGGDVAAFDWFTNGVQNSPAGRIHAQLQTAACANGFLVGSGLQVHCNPGASTWTLRAYGGAAVTIRTFTEIWPAVEKMTGRAFSPLDPAAIANRTAGLDVDD